MSAQTLPPSFRPDTNAIHEIIDDTIDFHSTRQLPPLYVYLRDPNTSLPSREYIRIIAYSAPPSEELSHSRPNGRPNHTNSNYCHTNNHNNTNNSYNSSGSSCSASRPNNTSPPIRHDFALHRRGARMCRLLETILDAADLRLGTSNNNNNNDNSECEMDGPLASHFLPPVVLPQATRAGCEAVFTYLELLAVCVPTVLSKPLRAPLEALVQPWEMRFLMRYGPHSHTSLDVLLEVAMISDFLLIESLRQLTCAFVASAALGVGSEEELLRLCGMRRALTEEELEPIYAQLPFLRAEEETG